jgi:hypothetical protein
LAAGVGLALRDNNPSSALRSAQGLAVSALSSARGQAALTQSVAKLIVQGDNTKETFLRAIRVVVSSDGGSTWKQVGGEIVLPIRVYVVPNGNGSVSGWTEAGSGRKSTFFSSAAPATVSGVPPADGKWISSGWISSLGVLTTGSGSTITSGNIVVGSGKITGPNLVTLDNNDAASFGN